MEIIVQENLPFLSEITIHYGGQSTTIHNVLVDCGSAGTAAETDFLIDIGILEDDPRDQWLSLRGIGGIERVRQKVVDITIGGVTIYDFPLQVGALGYGYDINGIVGFDLLVATKAVMDYGNLEVTFAEEK